MFPGNQDLAIRIHVVVATKASGPTTPGWATSVE
jgi:hypothetical protein